jgi:hypothetical protein
VGFGKIEKIISYEVYIYICIYINVYICVYICIYIHKLIIITGLFLGFRQIEKRIS